MQDKQVTADTDSDVRMLRRYIVRHHFSAKHPICTFSTATHPAFGQITMTNIQGASTKPMAATADDAKVERLHERIVELERRLNRLESIAPIAPIGGTGCPRGSIGVMNGKVVWHTVTST
jgi:hypothetical protein